MVDQAKLDQLWEQVNNLIKSGPINRSLWDAVAAAKPLALEENTLILGLAPKDMRHASYLETMINKTRILEVIQARTGRRFDLRVIEGATQEAWARVQERDKVSIERAEAAADVMQAHAGAIKGWEDLNERIVRLFSNTGIRRTPAILARLLIQSLNLMLDAETVIRDQDPAAEDIHNRELNRLFDKLGVNCEVPSTSVAIEYMRLRSRKQ